MALPPLPHTVASPRGCSLVPLPFSQPQGACGGGRLLFSRHCFFLQVPAGRGRGAAWVRSVHPSWKGGGSSAGMQPAGDSLGPFRLLGKMGSGEEGTLRGDLGFSVSQVRETDVPVRPTVARTCQLGREGRWSADRGLCRAGGPVLQTLPLCLGQILGQTPVSSPDLTGSEASVGLGS